MACRRNFCTCLIICLIFIAAPFAIAITLSYVGVEPKFYIENLHIQNNFINSSNLKNTSILMDLKFKRVLAFAPIRYDDLNITLYRASNRSFPVGEYVVPGFDQGRKKTAHPKAVVVVEDVISGESTVALAVELTTKYRLKQCDGDGDCGYTKPKAVAVAADVRLDGSGEVVSRMPIRLR